MRYVTQFDINVIELQMSKAPMDDIIKRHQERNASDVGILIKNNIGFTQDTGYENPAINRYRMEFEAFDYEDWHNFKSRLFRMVDDPFLLKDMINKLESKTIAPK